MAKKSRPKSSAPAKGAVTEEPSAANAPPLAFPKWTSVDITLEKWNNETKGGKGDKTKFPYDDPCGNGPLQKAMVDDIHDRERAAAVTQTPTLCML